MEALKNKVELEADYMKMEERERLLKEEAEKRGEERGEQRGRENTLKMLIRKKQEKGCREEVIIEALEELEVERDVITKLLREVK